MSNVIKIEEELESVYQTINETDVFLAEYSGNISLEPKKRKENSGKGLFKEKKLKKELLSCYEVLAERQLMLIKEQQKILQQLDEEIDNIEGKREYLLKKVERLEVVVNKITIIFNNRDK